MRIKTSDSRRYNLENYIIIIFAMLLFKFTPTTYLGIQWSNTLVEVIIFISLLFVWLFDLKHKTKINFNLISLGLLILIFVYIISLSRIYFSYKADIKELFNLLLYLMIYITISSFANKYDLNKKRIMNYIAVILFINIILSTLAYLIPNIFAVFNSLFETKKSGTIGNQYSRFAGTFSNPNFFGITFALFSVCFFYLFLSRKSKRIWFLIIAIACVNFVNISGSRSAMLTLFLLIGLMFFVLLFSIRKKLKTIKIISSLIIIGVLLCGSQLLMQEKNANQFWLNTNISIASINPRLLNFASAETNYKERIFMVNTAIDLFVDSPFWGVGPSQNSIDNQYAKYLMEVGIVFSSLFYFFMLYIFVSRIKFYKEEKNVLDKEIYFFTICASFALLFNMFGAAIFSVTQLTAIYFYLVGLNNR